MKHKHVTKQKMRANVVLGLGGALASLTIWLYDRPDFHLKSTIGLVLGLICLGQVFYEIWLWKHYPSYEQETVEELTRYKTAVWFGLALMIGMCAILIVRFLHSSS